MKVYEALEILAQLDPQLEVTVTFGKPKQITGDWHEHRSHQVYDKSWWVNPARKVPTDTAWDTYEGYQH